MKRMNRKTRILKLLAALTICLGIVLPSLNGFLQTAAATPYPKVDLTYLLGENVDPSTWTKADRAAWDTATGDTVIQTKSIYPDTGFATKASLIDGQKQTGLDYTNGVQYLSAGSGSKNINESITLNLQKMYKVNQVGITPSYYDIWYSGFPNDFTIEVSANGSSWKTVVTKTDFGNGYTPGQQDYLIPFDQDEICQYIRFTCTEILLEWNGTLNVLALQELEVYGIETDGTSSDSTSSDTTSSGNTSSDSTSSDSTSSDSTSSDSTSSDNTVITPGEIQVLENGKIDFTPVFGGATGTSLVGWDSENKYITTSHSFEVDWNPFGGKAFLIDGDKGTGDGQANYYASCTNDGGNIVDVNHTADVNEWILFDLQENYSISKFQFSILYSMANFGLPENFKLEVSQDGDSWRTVVDKVGCQFVNGVVDYSFSFAPVSVRYLRFSVSKVAESYGASVGDDGNHLDLRGYSVILTEIEFYTGTASAEEPELQILSDGKIDFTPLFGSTFGKDLVGWDNENKYITTSHSYEAQGTPSAGKAFLVDGDRGAGDGLGNYYASCTNHPTLGLTDVNHTPNVDEWILFDLQKNYSLNSFRFSILYASSDFGVPADFKLEVSQDGTTWQTVVQETGIGFSNGSGNYSFDFDTVAARYVRFSVSKVAESYGASLGQDGNHLDPRGYSVILTELELYTGDKVEPAGIEVGEDGKLDFSSLFEGATGEGLVDWDSDEIYLSVSHGREEKGEPSVGKAFLVDGSTDGNIGFWLAYDDDAPELSAAAEVDEWIYMNLQKKFKLGKVAFAPRYASESIGLPEDFKLEVSEDGIIWTTVVEKTGYKLPSGEDLCAFSFAQTSAQYIRFSVTKVAEADPEFGYAVQLSELQLYENGDGEEKLPDTSAKTIIPIAVACLFSVSLLVCVIMKRNRLQEK